MSCLWFLKGDTNVRYLHDNAVTIWDEWADEDGNLGPVYGRQWRSWAAADGREIDQLAASRRAAQSQSRLAAHVVSAWNVGELDQMALLPCHALFQFYVADKPAVVPVVSAQRRCVAGRALQYRLLCTAYPHGRAAVRFECGGFRVDRGGLPSVPESSGPGRRAADAEPVPAATPPHSTATRRTCSITHSTISTFKIISLMPAIKAPIAV